MACAVQITKRSTLKTSYFEIQFFDDANNVLSKVLSRVHYDLPKSAHKTPFELIPLKNFSRAEENTTKTTMAHVSFTNRIALCFVSEELGFIFLYEEEENPKVLRRRCAICGALLL